jgi:hypothetical protein
MVTAHAPIDSLVCVASLGHRSELAFLCEKPFKKNGAKGRLSRQKKNETKTAGIFDIHLHKKAGTSCEK